MAEPLLTVWLSSVFCSYDRPENNVDNQLGVPGYPNRSGGLKFQFYRFRPIRFLILMECLEEQDVDTIFGYPAAARWRNPEILPINALKNRHRFPEHSESIVRFAEI